MKIVLDTNVLVSALLSPFGTPAAILNVLLQGRMMLCMDERILAEYREVLSRPEFCFSKEQIRQLLDYFEKERTSVLPLPLPLKLPDPDGVPFLEVAIAAKVDALVTGNKRHFPPHARQGVNVFTPTEWVNYPPFRKRMTV